MHNQNKRRQTDEQICCCCREDEFQKDKEAIKRDKDEETEKESELMGWRFNRYDCATASDEVIFNNVSVRKLNI